MRFGAWSNIAEATAALVDAANWSINLTLQQTDDDKLMLQWPRQNPSDGYRILARVFGTEPWTWRRDVAASEPTSLILDPEVEGFAGGEIYDFEVQIAG